MPPRLKWSESSLSISEADISVSEVRIRARVEKVAKKEGCPRKFFITFLRFHLHPKDHE